MSGVRWILADSSVVRNRWKQFFDLASVVQQLRTKEKPIVLVVPAIAHTELVFALRREHGSTFNPQMVVDGLKRREVVVESLDQPAAERVATILASWFPTHDDWLSAKTNGNLDWHIAAHAMSIDGATLLVHDKGVEFSKVERKATLDAVLAELQQELATLP